MVLGLPLFVIFAVYAVVNTYLPVLLSSLGYSVTEIGILQGVFEAAGLAFPIFITSRVSRSGRFSIVITALAGLMIVVLPPLIFVRSFWVTSVSLALFAVGYKGTVPLVDTMVSRSLGKKAIDYGKVRVLGSIGFVVAALLLQFTDVVDSSSPKSIAWAIAFPSALFILSIYAVPFIARIRPRVESAQEETDADMPHLSMKRPRAFIRAFPRSFWVGIAVIFLGFFGMTPSQRFFSLYVRDYLGLEVYALLWAVSAAAEVPFMFMSGMFIKRFGTKSILLCSLAAIGLRNVVYAAFPSLAGAVAGQLFHSVCFGLFHPAAVVFIGERVPKKMLAVALTLYTSVSVGIASVLGNVAGGWIIDTFGYRPLFLIFAAFPLAAVIVFPFLSKRAVRR